MIASGYGPTFRFDFKAFSERNSLFNNGFVERIEDSLFYKSFRNRCLFAIGIWLAQQLDLRDNRQVYVNSEHRPYEGQRLRG